MPIYYSIVLQNLLPGEKLLVDTDSCLCFESSVGIDVQFVGNFAAVCCANQGFFYTTMTGPGKVWIQSMGIDKMRR
jgi:uncharacterized protein (AIM24 family)